MVYFNKPKKRIFLGILLMVLSSLFLGAQETSPKPSFNSQWDWHVGASFSPLYTGMQKGIWDTVEYLAILQRNGSRKEQGLSTADSFSVGAKGGFGWVFFNKNNIRMSFGGEYGLSYFRTKGTYTFGDPNVNDSSMPIYPYVPEEGAQQHLVMEGLDHKVSPYLKVSFLGPKFPIDLQLNVGVSFVHLVAMTLKDHDGSTYKVTAMNPTQTIYLANTDGFPGPGVPLNFSLDNTFNLALTTGLRATFHSVFVGFNYTTNVVQNSYELEVGLTFKNNFFKDAWN